MPAHSFTDHTESEKAASLAPKWQEPRQRSPEHPTKEIKILVVDDSISVRLILEDGLLTAGYYVLTAENGRKALEIIHSTLPDFVLTDVVMPEMDGIELCAALHENPLFCHIPIVVMSTEKDADNMRRIMNYRAAAFIIKPFNIEQLIITLNKLFSYEFMLDMIRETRNDWERTINALPEMIAIVDLEHRIQRVNTAMQKRLGQPLEEIIGQDFPMDSNGFVPLYPERLKDRMPNTVEIYDRERDGYYSLYLIPYYAVDEELVGSLYVFHDISEQKKTIKEKEVLHAQLLQTHKLESVGQLAAGIAHEINTPTQFVTSNIGFLDDAFADLMKMVQALRKASTENRLSGDVLKQVLETADWPYLEEEIPLAIKQSREGLSRVANLVRAMKEFSHPGGKNAEPVDINHLIETTATVARNEWKYCAELLLDLDPDLPQTLCLAGEMGQVFLNLLVNAAQAITEKLGRTPEDGKGLITITTKVDSPSITIQVTDTGCGIPDSAREKIFEPFFTTKAVGSGTGQGLAIAYDVVTRKHGGTLTFSTEVGKGTSFTVRLPMKKQHGDAAEEVK